MKANHLAEARRLNDRIHPTVQVFYADPFVDMHDRMKEAAGAARQAAARAVRPPLVKLREAEIARVRDALVEAGLLGPALRRNAAWQVSCRSPVLLLILRRWERGLAC